MRRGSPQSSPSSEFICLMRIVSPELLILPECLPMDKDITALRLKFWSKYQWFILLFLFQTLFFLHNICKIFRPTAILTLLPDFKDNFCMSGLPNNFHSGDQASLPLSIQSSDDHWKFQCTVRNTMITVERRQLALPALVHL